MSLSFLKQWCLKACSLVIKFPKQFTKEKGKYPEYSFGCGYLLQQWILVGDRLRNEFAVMIAPGPGRLPSHEKRIISSLPLVNSRPVPPLHT